MVKQMHTRLYRSKTDKVIAGVAGGLGEYFGIDPTIVRLIFILITVFGGSGVLIYIVLWLIIPNDTVVLPMEETIRKNADEMKSQAAVWSASFRSGPQRGDGRFWMAVLIIVFGLMFLLNNFGFSMEFGKLWPFWLIILGVFLLLKK